jgi:hypothetical protein
VRGGFLLILAAFLAAPSAFAQTAPDRARLEWISGIFLPGNFADVDFVADFSSFGGVVVERNNGFLDVDPGIWYGTRGTYRLNERWTLGATWMHHQGRSRIQFPAEASISGNFDLEGLLLAGDDFATGGIEGRRAERAMSDIVSDVYLASATFEFPILERWAFPYFSVGGGFITQKSRGNVIQFEYEGDLPPFAEAVVNAGGSQTAQFGLSVFSIDESGPVVSAGAGIRVSLSPRWGVNLLFEDIARLGADLTYIDATSTPPPDPERFRVYSTTFHGAEGLIQSFGIQFSLNYALWPYGSPR